MLDSYIWFSLCSQKIEGWLNICTSFMIYSHIWLNLPYNDCHFFYIFLWMITTFAINKSSQKKHCSRVEFGSLQCQNHVSIDNIIIVFPLLLEMCLNLDIDFYTHSLRIHAYQLHSFELLTNHAIFFHGECTLTKSYQSLLSGESILGKTNQEPTC